MLLTTVLWHLAFCSLVSIHASRLVDSSSCSHYQGETCSPQVLKYALNRTDHLYYEGLPCTHPSTCIMWATGRYNWDLTGRASNHTSSAAPSQQQRQYARQQDKRRLTPCVAAGSGSFVTDPPKLHLPAPLNTYHWQPDSRDCHMHTFSARSMYQCLAGRRILISGDSLLRQVIAGMT